MKISTLVKKQVISTQTGEVIGKIKDLEFDPVDFRIESVCIEKCCRGFLGWLISLLNETRIVMSVNRIVSIGQDVVLVECNSAEKKRDKQR